MLVFIDSLIFIPLPTVASKGNLSVVKLASSQSDLESSYSAQNVDIQQEICVILNSYLCRLRFTKCDLETWSVKKTKKNMGGPGLGLSNSVWINTFDKMKAYLFHEMCK